MLYNDRPLYSVPEGVETRWASPENPRGAKGAGGKSLAGRKGRACFPVAAGETAVLAEVRDMSGIIRRIWITIIDRSPEMLRGMKIEFFWDGCEKPAVSCPLGDFLGVGLGRTAAFECALFSNPEARSFNCYIPMPFMKGMKVTVTNESGKNLPLFYYDVDYTIGDMLDSEVMYLHAFFNRENPTRVKEDYTILPRVEGKGRFLGCNIGVAADRSKYFHSWWGEGEMKIYLDGDDEYPTLCGTGTEDYIGTGWGQGRYSHLYQGCPVADRDNMHYCFYRYHITDPVYFRKDIRAAMQQIGYFGEETKPLFLYNESELYSTEGELIDCTKNGPDSKLFERSDDWSSCAYFYLDKPVSSLPGLLPVEKRLAAAASSNKHGRSLAGE